ncbi:MAG: hypothetical protein SP4CHLAM5_02470 [Chlamydiia bacterium]|nr:hypothetical protein [Chlamydiia bacterium]MCH9618121.1 hypothetical protein [Chlamydiia bacterium]MCH9624001.1 hypothetical protein [Chlamydiia bacterium]
MKKNLLSGLALLLPLAVTVFIFVFLVDLLTTPFLENVKDIIKFFSVNYVDFDLHSTSLILLSRFIILILLFFGVFLLGFLGKRIFFHFFVKMFHSWMMKIPLINKIYKGARDIIMALLSEDKKIFSRVVAVPFPNEHSKALGLVTGNAPFKLHSDQEADVTTERTLKSVFVATSPHPLSGFLLLTEERYLTRIDFSVEDAFKYLISCGVFVPKDGD